MLVNSRVKTLNPSALKLGKVIVMNAETIMAERLLQVIKPRQVEAVHLAPGIARENESEAASFEEPGFSPEWLQVATLIGYGAHGVRELTSPLSD